MLNTTFTLTVVVLTLRLRSFEKYKYSKKILLLLAGQCQDDANALLFIVKAVYLKHFVFGDANVKYYFWRGLLGSIVQMKKVCNRQDGKLRALLFNASS